MKNIKWHKIGLIAFSIWMINSLTEIKLGGFRPYAIAMLLFILTVSLMSCSSTKYSYNKTKKKVERMTTPSKQYAFVNNQIVVFENN